VGGVNRRIEVTGCHQAKERPYLKNNQSKKKCWGIAQVVECLLSKHKALSSYPNTERKNGFQRTKL
jgi:hypothetical protein